MKKQLYKVCVITFEDRLLDPSSLMTQTAASAQLGVTVQAVQQLVERGRLTMIEDLNSLGAHSGRRLVLRAEIAAYAKRRKRVGK